MYTHQAHLFSDANQLNTDALQLPSDEVWQVADYGSNLMEAYKSKLSDCMVYAGQRRT